MTTQQFQMMKSEVTVAMYRACVQAGGCSEYHLTGYEWPGKKPFTENKFCNWGEPDREAHPMNCVDWSQAQAFATWVGNGARLCSEAEWEYAASGGEGRKYPWGSTEPGPGSRALGNFADETAKRTFSGWTIIQGYDDGHLGTAPACSFAAGNSKHDLCDLAGNVWEWVQDWYHDSYQGAPADGSAWVRPAGSSRVVRGGCW